MKLCIGATFLLSFTSISYGEKRTRKRNLVRSDFKKNKSPCSLEGIWVPIKQPICRIESIAGGEPHRECDIDYELELITDVDGTNGTLRGINAWETLFGEFEDDLIGYYDSRKCSFTLGSTSTGMTVTGKANGKGDIVFQATRPASGGKAVMYIGKLEYV
mmetsp:Transcript_29433/g.50121  ORF Transcript_29433/g.50121 Transcript_29433/m.50121 type:complete len:160 (+) Transcript_29433:41-520(+)|eukprot:CAMPEP_0183769086 /NCGR_PEP_ID=MMETSP0739-20130205/20793_1 /TAXON_ID=385413 /ORGANISM="Thalassiosira miniscula, Strain CCMP1093" /LENGTH=159 /DNA_ID=CAMNT_0026008589 /DNA_START=21 /DNA_END=500 /DNA_ORIENTATION=-